MAQTIKRLFNRYGVSIFTREGKVNGFESGISLWIEKPADWICTSDFSAKRSEKTAHWSGQKGGGFYIMKDDIMNI